MQTPEFSARLDLSRMLGAVLTAHAQDLGYWHPFVALRNADGSSWVFTTEEHPVAPRFEVFPLRLELEAAQPRVWRNFMRAFVVADVAPLWRSEWIEPGSAGPTLGSDPSTQYAGRGPVSSEAVFAARVLAGALLTSVGGDFLVVASSASAPLNVEVYLPEGPPEAVLQGFEAIPSNPSFQRTASGGR